MLPFASAGRNGCNPARLRIKGILFLDTRRVAVFQEELEKLEKTREKKYEEG